MTRRAAFEPMTSRSSLRATPGSSPGSSPGGSNPAERPPNVLLDCFVAYAPRNDGRRVGAIENCFKLVTLSGRAAALCLALALAPRGAEAHLVTTGLGPVYDGVAHFVLSPEDYVPIAGAALFAGLGGKDHARLTVLALPLAWFVGGVLGGLPGAPALVAPLWLPFLAVGVLVAADVKLPVGATGALFAALGLILGYPYGVAMAQYGQGLSAVAGSAAAIFVLVTLVAALAAGTTIAWLRIAWRVLGSWIAASGLLLLGWALRAR